MPLTACVMGAIALFAMAVEDGERPIAPLGSVRIAGRAIAWDARHVVVGLAVAVVAVQAIYYAIYFVESPVLAVRGRMPSPALWLPLLMAIASFGLHRDGWQVARLPFLLLGGIAAAIVNAPVRVRAPGQTLWRHVFDDVLAVWDRYALDRYLLRWVLYLAIPHAALVLALTVLGVLDPANALIRSLEIAGGVTVIWIWIGVAAPGRWPLPCWRDTGPIADRMLAMAPITTMRQLYLIGCYSLLGISVLAKGPPGRRRGRRGRRVPRRAAPPLARAVRRRVRAEARPAPDDRDVPALARRDVPQGRPGVHQRLRVPAHPQPRRGRRRQLARHLRVLQRRRSATACGCGPRCLPAALAAASCARGPTRREGRVRFLIALWAIGGFAFFGLVQTKFHHYILPVVPALGILVAFFLDDLAARRDRLHPLFAAARDRDRAAGLPRPDARAGALDRDVRLPLRPAVADRRALARSIRPTACSALGVVSAIAIAIAATRWRRLGVACLGAAGLAICIWSLQIYMPIAGTHWGMREAVRAYYDQRNIYGEKLVYFGLGELYDDWHGAGDRWTFETATSPRRCRSASR